MLRGWSLRSQRILHTPAPEHCGCYQPLLALLDCIAMDVSRLDDVLHRRIILSTLLTSRYCAMPIQRTCRVQIPRALGSTLLCSNTLQPEALADFLHNLSTLHLHFNIQRSDATTQHDCPTLAMRLCDIVPSLLCDKHQTPQFAAALAADYAHAIDTAMHNEFENQTSLFRTATEKLLHPILASAANVAGSTKPQAKRMTRDKATSRKRRRSGSTDEVKESNEDRTTRLDSIDDAQNALEYGMLNSRDGYDNAWKVYEQHWRDLGHSTLHTISQVRHLTLSAILSFPVRSNNYEDVNEQAVRTFYNARLAACSSTERKSILKTERLRWHPDKV